MVRARARRAHRCGRAGVRQRAADAGAHRIAAVFRIVAAHRPQGARARSVAVRFGNAVDDADSPLHARPASPPPRPLRCMTKPVRKVRIGMVGGGPDAGVGPAHRYAMRLDGRYELVAGVFSRSPDKSARMASELGVDASRVYASPE